MSTPRPDREFGIAPRWMTVLVVLLAVGGLAVAFVRVPVHQLVPILVAFAAVIALAAAVTIGARFPAASRLERRMREQRPGSVAFVGTGTDELLDALAQLGRPEPVPHTVGVTIGDDALELWDPGETSPIATFPWSEVVHADAGATAGSRVGFGRSTAEAAILVGIDRAGVRVELPIPVFAWRFPFSQSRAGNVALRALRDRIRR